MYDVTNESSFNNMKNMIDQIGQNSRNNLYKVLVGNKYDKIDRKVSEEKGRVLALEYKISFFEISAKTNQNIEKLLTFLTEEILKVNSLPQSEGQTIDAKKKPDNNKKCF